MTQTNLTRPQGLNRIDPVLREAAIGLGVAEFRAESLSVEREQANRRAAERVAAAEVEAAESAVAIETRSIDGPDGRPLNLRFYRGVSEGSEGSSGAPLVLYAHGGGFVSGNLDTDHAQCVELARAAGCLVVSVDYRLAPQHPYPAAIDDVMAVLRWAASGAGRLGSIVARKEGGQTQQQDPGRKQRKATKRPVSQSRPSSDHEELKEAPPLESKASSASSPVTLEGLGYTLHWEHIKERHGYGAQNCAGQFLKSASSQEQISGFILQSLVDPTYPVCQSTDARWEALRTFDRPVGWVWSSSGGWTQTSTLKVVVGEDLETVLTAYPVP